MKKIKSIHIDGRRWFQSTYGNTYCAVKVYINGEHVVTTDWTYGYGDYYIQLAGEHLLKLKLLKLEKHSNGCTESLWQHCADKKIKYTYDVADVLKRDLVFFSNQKPIKKGGVK
jgi:hypothetical protein